MESKMSNETNVLKKREVIRADIVVRIINDRPYFVICFSEIVEGHIIEGEGFGSYNLDLVREWREQVFKVINE